MAYGLQKLHTKLLNNSNNNVQVGTNISSKFFCFSGLIMALYINQLRFLAGQKDSEESQIIDARQYVDIL